MGRSRGQLRGVTAEQAPLSPIHAGSSVSFASAAVAAHAASLPDGAVALGGIELAAARVKLLSF